jgi:hypothetical protein
MLALCNIIFVGRWASWQRAGAVTSGCFFSREVANCFFSNYAHSGQAKGILLWIPIILWGPRKKEKLSSSLKVLIVQYNNLLDGRRHQTIFLSSFLAIRKFSQEQVICVTFVRSLNILCPNPCVSRHQCFGSAFFSCGSRSSLKSQCDSRSSEDLNMDPMLIRIRGLF